MNLRNRAHNVRLSQAPEVLAVVGTGTIACGLALCAAESGIEVTVWARSGESADREGGRLYPTAGVTVTTELPELSAATLVVEAIVEEIEPKTKLLRELDEILPATSLLATTTSALSVSELGAASGRPARFFGLHVFNPVSKMRLVELCFPTGCEDETRRRAFAFCERIGKRRGGARRDRVRREPPAVPLPLRRGAPARADGDGARSDRRLHEARRSHPMGPLELLDLVGLDVAESIGDALYAETGEAGHLPPGRIKAMVATGSWAGSPAPAFTSTAIVGRGLPSAPARLLGRLPPGRFARGRPALSSGRTCPRSRPPRLSLAPRPAR